MDNNIYKTVVVGNQIWMAENLMTTHYSDGSPITLIESPSEWAAIDKSTKAYCYYFNSKDIGDVYGALYTWAAAMNSAAHSISNPSLVQGVCPDGWHLPSDAEWKQLEMHLGMTQSQANLFNWRGTDQGGKLKKAGITHWTHPNTNATNESGFTALPGGYRSAANGTFTLEGYEAHYWSTTEHNSDYGRDRRLSYDQEKVRRGSPNKKVGLSVRCVRD